MSHSSFLRLCGAVALVVLAAVSMPSPALAGGDANFFLGSKQVEKDDWSVFGVDDSWTEFGAEVTWGPEKWPVWFATDVLVAVDVQENYGFPGNDVTTLTEEIALGLRKIWKAGATRPYIGGGLDIITAAVDTDFLGFSEGDVALGPWVGGGVFWRIGSRFNIGASVRWSDAEVTIEGFDLKTGGMHYGLLLGWGWPGEK
jgi:hypothetical protein